MLLTTAEGRRLRETMADPAWRRWGPYLSERQWGTVREDYSPNGDGLGLLPARSRAQPRLSLGRGRHRRLLRRPACAVPRARAVERPRSDPQGAAVRPDQRRGQSRRGRQGALLLPRRHADPLVHADALQVSAGRVPLRASWSRRTGGAARTQPEFELLDTGVFDDDRYFDVSVEYAKAAPDDILMRVTVDNRGPDAASLHLLPRSGPATPGPGRSGAERRAARAGRTASVDGRASRARRRSAARRRHAELLFCDNETNRARLYGVRPAPDTSRTASTTASCTGDATRSNPRAPAPSARRASRLEHCRPDGSADPAATAAPGRRAGRTAVRGFRRGVRGAPR